MPCARARRFTAWKGSWNAPTAPGPRVAHGEAAGITVARRRVLIVDDNQNGANSLADLLALQEHETQVAFSAKHALEQIGSFVPDVALLDIGLPEMDGYELARRLRAMPELNGIRLVALTGYGEAEVRKRTQAAGFDDHLVKPVDVSVLQRAIAASDTRDGPSSE